MKRKLLSVLMVVVLLLGLSFTFTACNKSGGTLVLASATDFGGESWMSATAGSGLSRYVSDTLFVKGKFQEKSMLQDFSVSEDGKEWTYTIKSGIKWHDGVELTADDFIFASEFYPQLSETVRTQMGWVKTYESYEKVDTYTFKIKLANADFTYWSRDAIFMAKHLWKDVAPADYQLTTGSQYWVGVGPFKLTEVKQGQYYVLEGFKEYHKGKPYLDGIIIRIVTDSDTAIIALQSGEIDFINIDSSKISVFENNKKYSIHQGASNNASVLLIDNGIAKYSDQKTRQALAYLIDYASITNTILRGYATQAKTVVPPTYYLYNDSKVTQYSYKIETARTLLTEAGWTLNSSGKLTRGGQEFTIKCQYMDAATQGDIIQVLASSFAQVGITLTGVLSTVGGVGEANINLGIMDGNNYDMKIWGATMPDPTMWETYFGDGGFSAYPGFEWFRGICNSPNFQEYQDIFNSIKALSNATEIMELYANLQEKMSKECVVIPLYFTDSLYVSINKLNFSEAGFNPDSLCYYLHLLYLNK